MKRLDGKVCIITGGAGPLGRGTARRFGAEGATVVVVDTDEPTGKAVAADVAEAGSGGLFINADPRDRDSAVSMVGTVLESFGRVDVLINAAIGFSPHAKLEDKTDGMFEAVFDAGYYTALWCMQAVFPTMRQQTSGRIVNFYSVAADTGEWHLADFNASRGAIIGLTNSAAAEWAKYRILCNAVGVPLEIAANQALRPNPSPDSRMAETAEVGRLADAEQDIAPVALFFASDDGCFATGSVIRADGGAALTATPSFPEATASDLKAWQPRDPATA